MSILKNKNSIYVFYVLVASIGWITSTYAKHIIGKIPPTALVLFDLSISFIFIILLVLFTTSKESNPINDLRGLTNLEWLGLVGLGLFGTTVRVFASSLLKHHAVETMRISAFMISMAVSGGAVYLLGEKELNVYRVIGFIMMAVGGYLFMP
mgnify:CR=1 FL=1|tara:strand:+ start:9129 stop:9584 length:456 start_codon:yes stop_codon:yes gene_type:complete